MIPALAPRYGGPSRAVVEMCRALEAREVETLIATTDADDAGRLSVELARPVRYRGVSAIFFPRQWSESFKYSRPLARWLDRTAREFHAMHIHAVFSHSALAAARACRRHGVPYVVRPLGTLDPWSLRQRPLRKRLVWLVAAGRMLRAAAAVHYTTDRERRAVEGSLGLRRGIVIPLGTEEGLLAETAGSLRRGNPAQARAPYVLVLSRLHPKKGLELLVEAFLDVVQGGEFPQWKLVVAGDGEPTYVRSLKRLVCERNGEAHVVFTGWLEGEARTAALQGAQLFALPSHQENFGLGVVEALGCEVPVLISDHVAVADEVRAAEAGWVAPRQRSALREAVEEALGDEGERARRGRAGRALVSRRFRWSAIAAELHALYSSLARGTEAGSRES